MKLRYDPIANAAYIQLEEELVPGGVATTYPCDPLEVGGMINLNFDQEGRLVGIEVLDARSKLPMELLAKSSS